MHSATLHLRRAAVNLELPQAPMPSLQTRPHSKRLLVSSGCSFHVQVVLCPDHAGMPALSYAVSQGHAATQQAPARPWQAAQDAKHMALSHCPTWRNAASASADQLFAAGDAVP